MDKLQVRFPTTVEMDCVGDENESGADKTTEANSPMVLMEAGVEKKMEDEEKQDENDESFEDLPVPDSGKMYARCQQMRHRIAESALCQLLSRNRSLVSRSAAAICLLAYFLCCLLSLLTGGQADDKKEQTRLMLIGCGCVAGAAAAMSLTAAALRTDAWQTRWRRAMETQDRRLRLAGWTVACLLLAAAVAAAVAVRGRDSGGLLGIGAILLLSFLLSNNKRMINPQPIVSGLLLQFMFAGIILYTQSGFAFFNWISDMVYRFMNFANYGAKFLFGENLFEHFFAFVILPTIVFFSSVISILFHFNIMQTIICSVGKVTQMFMGTTAAETTVAVANIAIGMSEAPLMVRPYLHKLTPSEVHSVMTSGMSTIAGGVFAAFVQMGVSPRHLLAASVMSMPGSLLVSKIMYPETKKSKTSAEDVKTLEVPRYSNVLEAAASGAMGAVPILVSVAMNLIAFVSCLEFLNQSLTWLGHRAGLEINLTFDLMASFVLWPVAWLMGTPTVDCGGVARLIGVKAFVNEFVAFDQLEKMRRNLKSLNLTLNEVTDLSDSLVWSGNDAFISGTNVTLTGGVLLHPKSYAIATYALCGFASPCSVAILIGMLTGLVPQRKRLFVACGVRAMIAGIFVNIITGCIASVFITDVGDFATYANATLDV